MATITDVSLLANVSKATVSRVLSGSRGVREESRLAVLEAAKALNYVPNVNAQSLATQANKDIAVIISLSEVSRLQDYLPRLSMQLMQQDLRMLVQFSQNAQEQQSLVEDYAQQCQAVVLIGAQINTSAFDNVILLDKVNASAQFAVGVDYQFASQTATSYLLGLGHRQIALFYQDEHIDSQIKEGYLAAMQTRAVPFNRQLLFAMQGDFEASCLQLLNQFSQFSAMVVPSATHAALAIKILRQYNLYVPQDVSLICLEDSELATQVSPQVTAISHDSQSLIDTCMTKISHLLGKQASNQGVEVQQGRLVCRESVQNLS